MSKTIDTLERNRIRSAAWYEIKKEDPSFRKKRKEYSKKYRKDNPEKRMIVGARQRAKAKGLPFDITYKDIQIPKFCPILKVKLEVGTANAPSLDRKVPELGYVKDNIWVISRKANAMKQDASEKELKEFASWVKNTFRH